MRRESFCGMSLLSLLMIAICLRLSCSFMCMQKSPVKLIRLSAFPKKPISSSTSNGKSSPKSISATHKSVNKNISKPSKPYSSSKASSDDEGMRINKCLPSLSRRGADDAVAEGRVTVNGQKILSAGYKVKFGDDVRLDGVKQQWESSVLAKSSQPSTNRDDRKLVYLKYWKPVDITCTNDVKDPTNIIRAGHFTLFPQRLFSVGRLDKDSSGLLLLTSDGRVNAAMLHRSQVKEKVYEVIMDKIPSDNQLEALRNGVQITVPVQKEHKADILIKVTTLPCKILRIPNQSKSLQFTLIEGRNRQIRRMAEAVGLTVKSLQRTSFAGITLKGLQSGEWLELSEKEMMVIQKAISSSSAATAGSSKQSGQKKFIKAKQPQQSSKRMQDGATEYILDEGTDDLMEMDTEDDNYEDTEE